MNITIPIANTITTAGYAIALMIAFLVSSLVTAFLILSKLDTRYSLVTVTTATSTFSLSRRRNINVFESEIKLLRSTQKSNAGLESKNITFEEQAQQVCVKGDIIHSTQELELITRKINTKLNIKNSKLTLNLLYKATADSDQASDFHEKCDKANRTIVLIETDKNKRFGGFTSKNWKGDRIEKNDEEAFIFSLDKMKTYDNIKGELAIGCYPKFGPIFMGCQIRIYDNAFTKGGTTFEKGLNYNTEEDYELNGGERNFIVKEIEVYEVIPQ